MTNRTENQVNTMLRTIKRRRWYAALLVCLALMVTAGVAGLFHLPAIAKTYQVTELTCSAVPPEGAACADFFVHIHNDVDCFDAEGNLVCPLPEIKPHRHTEECYSAIGELICTIPEVLLHTHTDDCYQKNEDGSIYVDEDGNSWLICGELQVLEHVHGPECFTTYELDDGEPEETGTEPSFYTDNASDAANTEGEESGLVFLFPLEDEEDEQRAESINQEAETGDDAATDNGDAEPADEKTPDAAENTDLKTGEEPAEETAQETVSESMPAEHFEAETAGVLVTVDAPEGAFPKGTTMVVSQVEMDDDTLSNVTSAVENGSDQKVVTTQAVDISFFDAEGNLIEPKLPIKVSMKSAIVSESENVALVHLTETDTAEPAENTETETLEAPAAEVVTDVQIVENANEDNEIQFESDAFSVYVLVGTETITTRYLTADGQTYLITVTCGPEAMIPEGAGLAVTEIPQNSEEYANYLAQAQSAVNAGENSTSEADNDGNIGSSDRVTVTTARFFDITILDAEGNPVEPAAPVDVKIEYMEPAETAENYQVVHFGAETEVLNPAVSGTEGTASAFDFQTNSFSIFGVVGITIERTILASDGHNYLISVSYNEEARIPANAELHVVEVMDEALRYEDLIGRANDAIGRDKRVDFSRFFDISIWADGTKIQPAAPVEVRIELIDELPMDTVILHYDDHVSILDTTPVNAKQLESAVLFEADSFSVYGIITTKTISVDYLSKDGGTFHIEVTLDERDTLPEGAVLSVEEIEKDTPEYAFYLSEAAELIAQDDVNIITFARFFNIEIQADGRKYEPIYPAQVTISYDETVEIGDDEDLRVVHFADEAPEIIENIAVNESGTGFTYLQNGFSVTGTVVGSFSGNNWPSTEGGDYILIVNSGNGAPYYAVNSNGSLTEVEYDASTGTVTFTDADALEEIDSYYWTYFVSGGNHRLTSKTNPNNKIYPTQTDGDSAISNSTNSPGANQGYIYRGNNYNRYCVAINNSGTRLISQKVTYNYYSYTSYTYPSNAAHFQFASNFEVDDTEVYGEAESIVFTGYDKTLRIAEVTTEDGRTIDFEDYTWTSSNRDVVTVSADPETNAPTAHGVAEGSARITGKKVNANGETETIVWKIAVKKASTNSIVFLHQPQNNANFATQDNNRPHDGFGTTEGTNYVKFIVVLADENGKLRLYGDSPDVELPEGSVVPDQYVFDLDSSGVLPIGENTFSGISVPGYSYAGSYAYFGWYSNKDMADMAVVDTFKNIGAISSHYPGYYSLIGFTTSRGNPQYQDYSQTAFGNRGYGYYAYNPTGVLMIVLKPVNENVAYRTSYHNDYVPGGQARTNVVDVTRAKMVQGEWIQDEYRYDWHGETIMTTLTGTGLTPPEDGYEFIGWFDSVDSEGNGTGNQIVGQDEEGNYYAYKNGEKIIIRQNNDFYARWRLVRGTLTVRKQITGNISETERLELIQRLTFTVIDKSENRPVATVNGTEMTWNSANTEGSFNVSNLSAADFYTVTEGDANLTGYTWNRTIEYPGDATEETGVKVSKITSTDISVKNHYIPDITVSKVVKTGSGGDIQVSDINGTIYLALKDKATGEFVKAQDDKIVVRSIQLYSGVPTPEKVSFAGIPDGKYEVWECYDENGTPLRVGDVFDQQGHKKGPTDIQQDWEKWFQLFSVEAESPTGKNNNIEMNGEPGEPPHITFTNTYSDVNEKIVFKAKKVWWKTLYNPINPGTDEAVTFALFRQEGTTIVPVMIHDGDEEKQYLIRLDGTADQDGEDQNWEASFKNLPKLDAEGNTIHYLVKETEHPAGYIPYKMDNNVITEMGETGYLTNNGGTIYNVKQIELKAKKIWTASQEDNKAPVSVQLYRRYEGGTEETVGEPFTLSSDNEWTKTIGDLPPFMIVDNQPKLYKYYLKELGLALDGSADPVPISTYHLEVKYYGTTNTDTTLPPNGWNGMNENPEQFAISENGILFVGNRPETEGAQMDIRKKWKGFGENGYDWTDLNTRSDVMNMQITSSLIRTTTYTDESGTAITKTDKLGDIVYNGSEIISNSTGLTLAYQEPWHFTIPESPGNDGMRQLPKRGIYFDGEKYHNATFSYTLKETIVMQGDTEVTDQWYSGYNVNYDGTWVYLFNCEEYDLTLIKRWDIPESELDKTKDIKATYFTVTRTGGGAPETDIGKMIYDALHSSGAETTAYGLSADDIEKITLDGTEYYTIKMVPANSDGSWELEQQKVITELYASMNYYEGAKEGKARDIWTETKYTVREIAFKERDEVKAIEQLCTPRYERKIRNNDFQTGTPEVQLGKAGESKIRVTNTLPGKMVSFVKQDLNGNKVKGAEFVLKHGAEVVIEKLTSNENGYLADSHGETDFQLNSLDNGDYYSLEETKAPDGYNMMREPVRIYVTAAGVSCVQPDYNSSATQTATVREGSDVLELIVYNNPGVVLPSTGGPGTGLFTAIGGIVTALAGAILTLKRRKEHA